MEHFSAQRWVDFVRGSSTPEEKAEMQRHLDKTCPACSRSMTTWRSVMQNAQQSRNAEAPDSSLQAVKAGFALRKVVSFPSGKLDLATLQFDSDRQPLAAGMRSGQATARQMLYKSGSVCIDMRMEPTPGSESMVLVGQLLDSMNPGHGLGGVPVSLLSKGDTVSRKRTNEAGEFDFGLKLGRDMQLVFGIESSRTIVVAVPEVSKRVM
jgi:anti-sigma factor RsiW